MLVLFSLGKKPKEREHLEDLETDERITMKYG
jgi:hypothetical protein